MLAVTLTLTDLGKGAKLLALLKVLPFVEIQNSQPIQPQLPPNATALFERYLQNEHLGWQHGAWSPIQVLIFTGIAGTIQQRFDAVELGKLYKQLAIDPGLFEAQTITVGERTAYCVYRMGFRVLYEMSTSAKVLRVFHIAAASALPSKSA